MSFAGKDLIEIMRQHVNPLSSFFQRPKALPSPAEIFVRPECPIHLDIGSARGTYLMKLASQNPRWNYLGLEIREQLVLSAEKERLQLDFDNLKFIFCNANISLGDWLKQLPDDILQRVSIQFPDPWFKKRHYKRRLLQPHLLNALAYALKPGRELFIQTDFFPVMKSMIEVIDASEYFSSKDCKNDLTLNKNPFVVKTEREVFSISKGLTIYRALFVRNEKVPR